MRNNILLLIAAVLVLFSGCGTKEEQKPEKTIGLSTNIEGDSTLYGLACDGCTDSVLVFLSGKGGDPVTYDIIDARKRQHIIGHPNVGDWVCLIVNGKDKKKADLVIDLDQLKGEWVNLENPVRRESAFAASMPKMGAADEACGDWLCPETFLHGSTYRQSVHSQSKQGKSRHLSHTQTLHGMAYLQRQVGTYRKKTESRQQSDR